MSDPEPSAAVPSSSPPSVQASESAAALNYAFLVHSQKTLTQNLPPRVDNKLLARQKRRRTSPEDHAILESEYQRNPKPDKTARTSIVNRVSLGEKEVQIWFQNRRQNDRRKSKPLQPHELLAPRITSSDPLRQPTSDDIAEPGSSSGTEQIDDQEQERDHARVEDGDLQSSFESEGVTEDKDEPEQPLLSSQTTVASESLVQKPSNETTSEATRENASGQLDESQQNAIKRKRSLTDLRGEGTDTQQSSVPTGLGVISPPSLRLSMSFDGEAMVRREGEMTPSPPKGRNALRIAMSSDGKAVIRADDEPSPSKNRIAMFSNRKSRLSGLRRSNSAAVLGTPRGGMPEKERNFGRSRDPRNWESFVDTDARSALSTPMSIQSAPNTDTPGLYRSRSQRSLTRSLSSRQNVLANRPDLLNTPVPQQTGEKRRKLSRTVSSLGRLESGRNALADKTSSPSLNNSKMLSSSRKHDDDGDSDKENWLPGTRVSHVRRRTTSHNPQRPVLREAREGRANKNLTANRRSRLSQQQRKISGKSMPELGAEVSAFMAGGGGASQEEDLDCIQGLLSLSQGAWK